MTKSSRSSTLRTFLKQSIHHTAIICASLLVIMTADVSGAASVAKVVVDSAPIKMKPALLGAQTVKNVSVGTDLNVLSTKGTFSEVEVVGDTATKGWILTAQITTDASVMKAIGTGKGTGGALVGSAIGSTAKGIGGASYKGAVGNVAKGLTKDSEGSSESASAEEPVAETSAEMEKIDSSAVTEAELMAFMKEGGLKSRLIK